MEGHIYKSVELTGTSTASLEDAVSRALARAARTVRNMRWFEVVGTRGTVESGRVAQWQVTLKVGFSLED